MIKEKDYFCVMKRAAFLSLKKWKTKEYRKPLIVYGPRQVGKTWLIQEFGKKEFQNYIYLNFEKTAGLRGIFEQDYNPERIIKILEIHSSQKVNSGKTLVIFDEIQEAEGGLTALKYFCEDRPDLHLIAAGSLLGISLARQKSFPVGKVEFLALKPLSFLEFLSAMEEDGLRRLIEGEDLNLAKPFGAKLQFLLKQYFFVGGMPESVQRFAQTNNFDEVRQIHNDILNAYERDFAKHAPGSTIPKIRAIWNSVVSQLSRENKKFVYGVVKEGARAKDYEGALEWLESYGIVNRVYRVSKPGRPLSAYADIKAFKLYLHDVGLLCSMAGLHEKVLLHNEEMFTEFKGALTEQFVLQELLARDRIGNQKVWYWTNPAGKAELDFIFEHAGDIIPIEVKSSQNVQSKSLKIFIDKYPSLHGYRASLKPYRAEERLTNYPLFAVTRLGIS